MKKAKVLLNTEDFQPSTDGKPYFLVAKNGIFLQRENDCFSASIKIDDRLGLSDYQESVDWKLPPIDARTAHTAINFARYIRKKMDTECLLWLYYSVEERKYRLYIPKQKATSGSVTTSDSSPAPENFLKVGTLHSHPGAAFHSQGDKDDEIHNDGVHIVIGHLDHEVPDICSTIVVHGKRFPVNYQEVMDIDVEIPKNWLDRIKKVGED